ncbi:conjugal transfer protein TraN [Thiomicrorhabdus aquaedulcis]|uniref:conjugal transfer protein TraN n=1 Tax=Thiomicrorhabdus aquaedulcis TaxID=2211106 RepID=UPI001562D79E|nr:conjugal transfer protein TraN [Thiomicrorhabdus aquaedulcis]
MLNGTIYYKNYTTTGRQEGGYYTQVALIDVPNLGASIPASCQSGYSMSSDQTSCSMNYPATQSYQEAQPGCMGGAVYSAGQEIKSSEELVSGTQSGGTMTCESENYSCPAGMAMNGSLCEDLSRMQYATNPKCVNLGYIAASQTEGFLCITQELTECAAMPNDCTEKSSVCVYKDEIPNSPTYNQCLATERTMVCPVPGETVISENCSYKPMCMDGNCFEQEQKCPIIPGVSPVQHYDETCQNITREDIQSCPVTYTYSAPDENGERVITGANVNTSTCTWSKDAKCKMAVVRPKTDEEGKSYWPTVANFSCLGDTMNLCASLDADKECTLTNTENEQFSIDGSTPIVISKHFDCARAITTASDTCTDDFAKMAVAMEASRQGGNYFDPNDIKIFGGEFHRCDRREAAFGGVSFGSKSCCNISAPDPQNNRDVLAEAKMSIGMQAGMGLIDYSIDSGTSYVYDFMMNNSMFQSVSTKLMGMAGMASSAASQSDMLADQVAGFDQAQFGVSYAGIGISYVGGAEAAGQVLTTGGWTGSSSMSLGGGFQLQFSPVGFYIFAAMQLYQMYQAALACDEDDYKTATLTKGKLCYSHGSWCEKKDCGLFGCTCVKYRTGKCCFNSKLARIINEQGRKQLGLTMKDCNGFTIDQLQKLDWGKIDLSEFISDMLNKAQQNLPTADDLKRLNDKVIDTINTSSPNGVQPIDLGKDGKSKVHN